MNPVILRDETIKRYGWDPKNYFRKIGKKSESRARTSHPNFPPIVIKCPSCSVKRSITVKGLDGKPAGICKDCSLKAKWLQQKHKPAENFVVTPSLLCDLLFEDPLMFLRLTSRENLYKTVKVLQTLGIDERKTVTTKQLRKAIVSYLCSLDTTTIFSLIGRVIERHIKVRLYESVEGKGILRICIRDFHSRIEPLLHATGFSTRRDRKGHVYIVSGSLYINEEWIHIG